MKYTQLDKCNTQLSNPQKAVFILKQVLILEACIKGNEIFSLTEFHLTISSGHLISDS